MFVNAIFGKALDSAIAGIDDIDVTRCLVDRQRRGLIKLSRIDSKGTEGTDEVARLAEDLDPVVERVGDIDSVAAK